MALGSTQPLIEISARNLEKIYIYIYINLGVKGDLVRRADNFVAIF
jgi:hypothetical protein